MKTDITSIDNWSEKETNISNLYCWIFKYNLKSKLFSEEEIYPNIIAYNTPSGNNITQFNFRFIESIINNIDFFFEKAILYIQRELLRDPRVFGLTQEKSETYRELEIREFPVFFLI